MFALLVCGYDWLSVDWLDCCGLLDILFCLLLLVALCGVGLVIWFGVSGLALLFCCGVAFVCCVVILVCGLLL